MLFGRSGAVPMLGPGRSTELLAGRADAAARAKSPGRWCSAVAEIIRQRVRRLH